MAQPRAQRGYYKSQNGEIPRRQARGESLISEWNDPTEVRRGNFRSGSIASFKWRGRRPLLLRVGIGHEMECSNGPSELPAAELTPR